MLEPSVVSVDENNATVLFSNKYKEVKFILIEYLGFTIFFNSKLQNKKELLLVWFWWKFVVEVWTKGVIKGRWLWFLLFKQMKPYPCQWTNVKGGGNDNFTYGSNSSYPNRI